MGAPALAICPAMNFQRCRSSRGATALPVGFPIVEVRPRLPPAGFARNGPNSVPTGWSRYDAVSTCLAARGARRDARIGGPCRDRTYDQRIKSPVLYQLS